MWKATYVTSDGGVDSQTSGCNADEEAMVRVIASGMGSRSRWALRAAADAAETEGIAGVIVIKIPPKGKDYVDITFTIGQVEIVSRWAG